MFMSGGSRGIGLAIAMRAARDGAKVALMAKTAEPHPKLPGTDLHRGGGDRGGRRRGAADRRRHPRREAVGRPRPADRRALRRHRPGRQQRQRDQPRPHARAAGQALRPDAADQRARHVRRDPGLPALPARVRPRARADAVAAAVDRPALARRPQRLHAFQDGHDDDHARRRRRRGRGRHRRQLPLAAHDHRHRRRAEPARR